MACTRGDTGLHAHLMHGTPYVAYRDLLKSQFPAAPELEPSYDWKIFGHDGPLFDPAKSLPAGKLVQELLFHLLSDFYRPITLASLATRLFPGEFYNPTYTPNRVHQLVKRLRTWIAEHAPGLIIEENQGSYRLSAEAPIVVELDRAEVRIPLKVCLRR